MNFLLFLFIYNSHTNNGRLWWCDHVFLFIVYALQQRMIWNTNNNNNNNTSNTQYRLMLSGCSNNNTIINKNKIKTKQTCMFVPKTQSLLFAMVFFNVISSSLVHFVVIYYYCSRFLYIFVYYLIAFVVFECVHCKYCLDFYL